MPSLHKEVYFANYVFDVDENVYEPAEDSFLFAENLAVRKNEVVLDIGVGCGILSVIAADNAARVVAVDISPHAVRCAKKNADRNGVADKICLVQGDLFAPIHSQEKFGLILFNAPYLPSESSKDKPWLQRAWAGGAGGREIIDRFICEATTYLKDNGQIFLMQSTLSGIDETIQKLKKGRLRANVVAEQALPFFEKIVLLRAES